MMSIKDLRKLSVNEAKNLKNILDRNQPFLNIPELDDQDSNSPIIYECILLALKILKAELNAIERKNYKPVNFNNLAWILQNLFLNKGDENSYLGEIWNFNDEKRSLLSKQIVLDMKAQVEPLMRELSNKLCSCLYYNPEFANLKNSFVNPIDFDIFLLAILRSEYLVDYLKDVLACRYSNSSFVAIEAVRLTLSPLYSRTEISGRIHSNSSLFIEDWVLDYHENAQTKDIGISLSTNMVKKLFKLNKSFIGSIRPPYELIDTPDIKLDDMILPAKTKEHIRSLCDQHKALLNKKIRDRLTFFFKGEPGTGKTHTAYAIANKLGMKIINVNVGEYSKDSDIPSLIAGLMRRAEAKNYVLLFDECEDVIGYNAFRGKNDAWAKKLFENYRGVAIFTTNYTIPYGFDRRVNYFVELKKPEAETRFLILKKEIKFLLQRGILSKSPSDECLQDASKKFNLSGGYYSQVLKLASSLSTPTSIIEPAKLMQAFEHVASTSVTKETTDTSNDQVRESKIKLSDVHLNKDLREETELFINYSKKILADGVKHPLLPKGATAMFSGLPGTGKTILAEAIANELNISFRKVSPSSFLSKWVGETEQKMKEVFKDAERNKCLLFIDEAEGIFLDRKGADRSWEKTQVDELLQQLEDYRGVLVIATNFKEMIDEAFARRFVFHFNFTVPDETTRQELWKSWNQELSLSKEEVSSLAKKFELTGGEIRNLAVQFTIRGKDKGYFELLRLCEQALTNRTGHVKRKLGL